MDIEKRLATLKTWFEIYDEFMAGFDPACGKGCAACCTCNVTGTTLEGLLIYDHFKSEGMLDRCHETVSEAPKGRFQPAITLNQMVALCLNDLNIPEETNDPDAGPCIWLKDDLCPIYAIRPFACRAMCSLENCDTTGEAQMPPLVLSANNVMMQFVEALDRPGGSGNIADVLCFLNRPENHQAYVNGMLSKFPEPLKPNLAFEVLMIPPEHRQQIEPLVQRLQHAAKEAC